jgi:hypothetical protein
MMGRGLDIFCDVKSDRRIYHAVFELGTQSTGCEIPIFWCKKVHCSSMGIQSNCDVQNL